jgi:phosphatidate cytidylyltransferase
MTTSTPVPAQDHGRAGRNLPAAITSAVVLVALVIVTLVVWKTLFMVVVAAAVLVAMWELHRGFAAKDIDLPEQPLMAGGVIMVVVAYFYGAPALVTATAVTALVTML